MSNIGCFMYMVGVMLCGPEHKVVHTYVAGQLPAAVTPAEKHQRFFRQASEGHRALWNNLTDEQIDTAFADRGPRRHLPIDWSKVRGVKAP